MSPPNDITATQSPTVRVTVDDASRREAAEPIGRSFADLLDDVRPKDDSERPRPSGNKDRPQQESPSGGYLVVNASLSEPTAQTTGLLQHATNPGAVAFVPKITQAAAAPSPELAATDEVSIDTGALFLPPNPNQPAQVDAAILSAGFALSSWPPLDAPSAMASLLTAAGTDQPNAQPTANATLDAAPIGSTPTSDPAAILAGGPGANRSANRFLGAEQTQATTNATATGTPANASSATGGATPHPTAAPAQATGQPAPPVIDLAAVRHGAPLSSDLSVTQPLTASQPGAATTHQSPTAATHAAPQTLASAPAATVQIYARFIERFDGRSQQYQVRLDPPELGRVNVRIEINSDNRVHAVLATHDSAALSDLVRGQRALEQALADAGIDLADGGLQFQLSDRDGGDFAANDQDTPVIRAGPNGSAITIEGEAGAITSTSQHAWSRGRVNIVA